MPRKDTIDIGELTDPAFYILSSLIEKKHGYLIMKNIEELTENEVSIGPASLYTTLKKLLKAGFVEVDEVQDGNKKVYQITAEGIDILVKEVERKKRMVKFAEYFLKDIGGD